MPRQKEVGPDIQRKSGTHRAKAMASPLEQMKLNGNSCAAPGLGKGKASLDAQRVVRSGHHE